MWADEKQNHLKNHDTGLITFLSQSSDVSLTCNWNFSITNSLILKDNFHPFFNMLCDVKLLIPNAFLTFSSFTP